VNGKFEIDLIREQNFDFGVLLSCLVSSFRNHPHQSSNPRYFRCLLRKFVITPDNYAGQNKKRCLIAYGMHLMSTG
jgi:hypothetical protein